jgi:lysozyme
MDRILRPEIEPYRRDLTREWMEIPGPVRPTPPGAARTYLGIDTASVGGNTNPDWVRAKAQVPIAFAIIRSNWGTAPDRVFPRDWPKLKAAGIVRGAYLFLRFPRIGQRRPPDPVAQARAFIATVGGLERSDLPPALDVEFPGGRKETGMTPRQLLDGARDAWRTLRDHYGAAPIIYTSARVWREDLADLPAPDLIESPLWLARYPFAKGRAVYDPRRLAGPRFNPPVPPPWRDATNWWIHQYQGDAVGLPGFPTGNVDMNRFNPMASGATGDRVRWVQRRLAIPQSGAFDAVTERALRSFQSKRGLAADGVVDPRTFAYLCWSAPLSRRDARW